jgi:hypothetical protein
LAGFAGSPLPDSCNVARLNIAGGVAQRDGTFIESNRLRNVFRHSFTPEQRVTEGRQRRRIPKVGPSAQRGQILRLRPDSRRQSRDHQRSRHQGA